MKRTLLLLFSLLTLGVSGVWADPITWESKSGWVKASGGMGGVTWFGVHTPGDANTVYNFTEIQIMQETGNGNNSNYLAIARSSNASAIGVNEVIAISDNQLAASSGSPKLESYNFEGGVNLLGGTTYYFVFISSNTPTNGAYPVRASRLSVNHTDYGTYTYGCSSASWWPYFTAQLTETDAVSYGSITYSYQVNGREITTQTIENLVEGHIYPTPSSSLNVYGCGSPVNPTGTITDSDFGNTKVITVPWTLFSYSNNYKSITKWYTVRMHSNQTHYLKSSGSAISFTDATDSSNDYLWGFVGNPIDGFQLYPYNTGSKAIDDNTPCTLSATGTSNTIKVKQGANGTYGAAADFCIAMYVTDGNYYNYQSGAIKRWESNDQGSAIMLDEAIPVTHVLGSTAETPIYYAWRTAVGNSPAYVSVDGETPVCADNTPLPDDTNPISDAYAWQFIGDATNGFLIKNKQSGKYLGGREASGGYMSMVSEAQSYFRPVSVSTTTNKWYCETYDYFTDRSSGKLYAHSTGNNNDYVRLYNVKFVLSDDDSGLKVGEQTISDFDTPVLITTNAVLSCGNEDFKIGSYDGYNSLSDALINDDDGIINVSVGRGNPITYHLTWFGETLSTEIEYQHEGEATIDGTSIFGDAPVYCSYGDPSIDEIEESTTDVNIALEWGGPFTVSSSYASATWYYMTLRSSTYYVIYDPSSENKTSTSSTTAKSDAVSTTERALWAFMGDPINGFKVMNKAAGDALYLNSFHSPLRMQALDGYSIWMIEQNGTGFTLNNEGYYLNDVSRELGYWDDAQAPTDEGSTIRLETVDYYELAQAYLTQFATANAIANDGYFGVRPADATLLSDGYNTAFSANHSLVTAELYENTLKPAIKNLIKYPETGFYRIKSSGSRGRTSYLTYGKLSDEKGYGLLTTSGTKETDFGTVVKLTRDGDTKNYTLSIQGLNVQAHSGDNILIRANNESAYTYSIQHIDNNAGMCSIYDGTTHGYIHEAGWYNSTTGLNGIVGWEVGDGTNASSWSIEDATTVTINLTEANDNTGTAHRYATLCVPFNITGLAGADSKEVKAYAPTLSGDYVVTGEGATTITEGTPVILIGESGATSVTATIGSNYALSPATTNVLRGIYASTSIDASASNNYVLGFDEDNSDRIGFYHVSGGSSFALGANKAYLPASGGSVKGFAINYNDLVDGIKSIDNGQLTIDNAVYNLAGQRMSKLQRGVNIVNGMKVIIK